MKLFYLAAFLFIYCYSFSQDSVRLERQYRNDKPSTAEDSFLYKMPNIIFVYLDEGFNDSLKVTLNGEEILNRHVKTNESLGRAASFIVNFKKPTDTMLLRLKFVNANFYIEEKLDLTYKSVHIMQLKPWTLIYTNHFYLVE